LGRREVKGLRRREAGRARERRGERERRHMSVSEGVRE
jgi:hypothetical protein